MPVKFNYKNTIYKDIECLTSATIYKAKGNKFKYVIRYTKDVNLDSEYYEKGGFNSVEEAEEEMGKTIEILKLRNIILSDGTTMNTLKLEYLEFKKLSVKPSTFETIGNHLDRVLKGQLRKNPSTFFKKENLINTYNNVIKADFNNSYSSKRLIYFKEMVSFSARHKLIPPEYEGLVLDYMPSIVVDRNTKRLMEPLTEQQYKEILDKVKKKDGKHHLLLTLLGDTGMRIGELRGLQAKHYDPKTKTLLIEQQAGKLVSAHKTVISSPKTNSSIRRIRLSDKPADKLDEYFKFYNLYNHPDYFILSAGPKPIYENYINNMCKEIRKLFNLKDFSTHFIRHCYITWVCSRNLTHEEIGQLSRRVGHKDISTTLNVYMNIHENESSNIINFDSKINSIKEA